MAALRYQLHHPSEKMGEATTSSRHHDSTLHLTYSLAPLYTYSNNTRRSHTSATDNTISQELELVFGAGALHDIYPSQSPPGAKNKQRRRKGYRSKPTTYLLYSSHTHAHQCSKPTKHTKKRKTVVSQTSPPHHTRSKTDSQTVRQSDSQPERQT